MRQYIFRLPASAVLALLFLSTTVAQTVPDLYIVELAGEPAIAQAVKEGRREASGERLRQIHAEQQSAGQRLAEMEAQVLDSVSTVANALIVRIPDANAGRLRSVPGVARIYPVWRMRPVLDRATALHSIRDAWSQSGGEDRAGLGIKIGIIDTGIDPEHPGFQDNSLPAIAGYPRGADAARPPYEGNRKIIVVRNYEPLSGDGEAAGRDTDGHGTGVAMAAAGVRTAAPLATVSGAAPKAYIGCYRVFDGNPEGVGSDRVLRAFDDAVADGMDVINISLGSGIPFRPSSDPYYDAVQRAARAGVIVVAAAGNEGPLPNSLSPPASNPDAIGVGAITNDRIFSTLTTVGDKPYRALPGSGPQPGSALTGTLMDAAEIQEDGLLCDPLPEGGLEGKVALILRGVCTFEVKLNNARDAGAAGALVYTHAEDPEAVAMNVGSATLPAMSISYPDGSEIKDRIRQACTPNPGLRLLLILLRIPPQALPWRCELPVELQFALAPFVTGASQLARFSSRGPNADGGIKPDLVAVGSGLYTATQKQEPSGDSYDASGFIATSGTSFSSPVVAGSAAVLKAARPRLEGWQYRSLLVNSAAPFAVDGVVPGPQTAGTGSLNLAAALRNNVAVTPVSIGFGTGPGTVDALRKLTVANLGTTPQTFTLTAAPRDGGIAPQFPVNSFTLAPGASTTVDVRFTAGGLAPGQYQGVITLAGSGSDSTARVPYWYGVPSHMPRNIRAMSYPEEAPVDSSPRTGLWFQITDESGIPVTTAQPVVTAVQGGGSVGSVTPIDDQVVGGYIARVRIGPVPGVNVYEIEAGGVTARVTIMGIRP